MWSETRSGLSKGIGIPRREQQLRSLFRISFGPTTLEAARAMPWNIPLSTTMPNGSYQIGTTKKDWVGHGAAGASVLGSVDFEGATIPTTRMSCTV